MNKLIIPDIQPDLQNLEPYNRRVEEICLQLEAKHPDWIRFDEDTLLDTVDSITRYVGKTFIVPEVLVSSRRPMTKVDRLVTFMFSIARKLSWNFVVIAPSLRSIDIRLRVQIEEIEDWR